MQLTSRLAGNRWTELRRYGDRRCRRISRSDDARQSVKNR